MRILHVVSGIARQDAGPSSAIPELCKELINRGHDVTLSTLAPPPPSWEEPVPTSFHPSWRFPRKLGVSPSMKHYLRRAAQSVDIVHMHGLWMMPNIYPASAVRGTDARLVLSPRGMLNAPALRISSRRKRVMWMLRQRRAVEAADLIHATSEMEASHIRSAHIRSPIAVVPLGVRIPPMPRIPREPVILYLGRLHPIKAPDHVIRAWGAIEHDFPEWRLRLVGPAESPAFEASLRDLVKMIGARRIEFAGGVYGDAKVRELQSASLFVLPTLSENFALTVAEALAAGVPAIVTKGAPWEGLEEHGGGWWIDHGVEPLALALRHALSLPRPTLTRIGERGREWMRRDCSWPAVAAAMEDAYCSVIGATFIHG